MIDEQVEADPPEGHRSHRTETDPRAAGCTRPRPDAQRGIDSAERDAATPA